MIKNILLSDVVTDPKEVIVDEFTENPVPVIILGVVVVAIVAVAVILIVKNVKKKNVK